jgi:DHA2 family multidrug resistance protein-like MFS transporter
VVEQALSTLGGAVTAAAGLSAPSGPALASAARAAFMDAMQVAALVGALILVVASVCSARILRNGTTGQAGASRDQPRIGAE